MRQAEMFIIEDWLSDTQQPEVPERMSFDDLIQVLEELCARQGWVIEHWSYCCDALSLFIRDGEDKA